ncbi:glycoside hydrolase family 3 protein [Schizothecium vesticola]|uniref:beta-glucosidase n=1 Tax=Schizothecium vesticola TaxID=314040 RepID=A0AA40F2L2_9PEZI|nr:glycoside hydrolase family 3 protein [Schizothecium vesticola]
MAVFLRLAVVAAATAAAASDPYAAGYPSPWASGGPGWDEAYAKAKEFVSGLTLLEKVNLTSGTGWQADECVGNTGSVPRLGFRGFCMQDGPLGIRFTDQNSAFPAGINAGATFSRRLMRLRGEAMGEEFYGKGIDVQLGPASGPLGRVPQGGRNWEGFGADPYLAGVGMAETIQGIQSRGVIACAKHWLLNEQETYREKVSVTVDDRTMHELYMWPFADAVRAGVGSVMCSYNKIESIYACENNWTTNYLLKNELNFQGFVMSDWGAQHTKLGSALSGLDMAMPGDFMSASKTYPPYNAMWGGNLTESVLRGEVPQWRLDDMVVRIMAAYFKVHTGKYTARPDTNFYSWSQNAVDFLHKSSKTHRQVVNKFVNVQGNHAALIREIGAKSTVLLKNTYSALPLRRPTSIAVFGRDAHDDPAGPNACPDRACINGTVAMGWGSGTANFPYLIAPVTALRARALADATLFANISDNYNLSAAASLAASASAALVFVTANSGEAYLSVDANAGDRNNLTLWDNGSALVAAVASTNPNTIVILHTAGPVALAALKANPNVTAILWAGLPGQESGNAILDVLYGAVNPQAKSPFTWAETPEAYGATPMFKAADPLNPAQTFDEGVFIDYRHFQRSNTRPTYEFGFGLSYTAFGYANLRVTPVVDGVAVPAAVVNAGRTAAAPTFGTVDRRLEANLAPEGFEKVWPYVYPWLSGRNVSVAPAPGAAVTAMTNGSAQGADVSNEGEVAGTEVPQLYVQLGGTENPWGVLRGFEDVHLEPGETKTVVFELTRRDISNWNTTSQNWEIWGKEKFVFVGSSSEKIRLNATLPAPKGLRWTAS